MFRLPKTDYYVGVLQIITHDVLRTLHDILTTF